MATSPAKPNTNLVDSVPGAEGPTTKANSAMHPKVISEQAFTAEPLQRAAFYADDTTIILNMDVRDGLKLLADAGILEHEPASESRPAPLTATPVTVQSGLLSRIRSRLGLGLGAH